MIDNLKDAITHTREKAKTLKQRAIELRENKHPIFSHVANDVVADNYLERAEYNEQIAAWLEELSERREADRWISIKDRLPDKNGNYLVSLNNGEMTTDIFDEEELFMGFWGYMTHWRPLPPKPYESEATNER